MISTILSHAVVGIIGAIIGIFVYRNNTKPISDVADKVDKVWDDVEEKLDKK